MPNKLISIIVPVYNSEKYLKKCLNSIMNQTYKQLEIIIINDGSTDNCLNIIQELQKIDSRIILIDKKNNGVSSARNDGIKKATGKYIMFIDSDDWIETDYIETMYNYAESKKLDVCRTGFTIDRNDEPCEEVSYINDSNINIDLKKTKEIFIDTTLFHSACVQLIKRNCVLDNNIYFDEDILYEEDLIFNIKLYKVINKLDYINCCKYHYTANEKSATRNIDNIERIISSIIKSNNKMITLFNNKELTKLINGKHLKLIVMYLYIVIKKDFKYFKNICKNIKTDELKKIMNNYTLINVSLKEQLKVIMVSKLVKIYIK